MLKLFLRPTHLFYLVLVLLVLAILPSVCFGQSEATILLTPSEWAHVSVGETKAFSFRYELIGSDPQVVFHAFQDVGAIFSLEIVQSMKRFRDPFGFVEGYWTGSITAEGRATFVMSSVKGPVTATTSAFTGGPVSAYGRPPPTYQKIVATKSDMLYDLILAGKHTFSFDFRLVENQTVPLLKIYNPKGEVLGEFYVTASMKPYEYGGVEGVGFMMQEALLNQSLVKWIIYSGKDITIRPSKGWVILSLPFAVISPDRVEPDQTVTIRFILPEGTTTYTTNLNKYPVSDPTHKYDSSTKEHVLTFKFYPEARGKRHTILIACESFGARYQSELIVEVLPYPYEPYLTPIVGFTIFIVIIVLLIRWVRGRMPPAGPDHAIELGEQY